MSPILTRTSGVTVFATAMERQRRSGSAPGPYEDATNFWDFGDGNSYNDQIGSLDFTLNTDEMALNNSTVGGPPGWTSAGYIANDTSNGVDHFRTADDNIPDWSGKFTFEMAFYITYDPTGSQGMPWCVGNATDQSVYSWQMNWYGASATLRGDTAGQASGVGNGFGARIGEINTGTNLTDHNEWMLYRMDFNGTNFAIESWEKDGSTWSQQGSTSTFSWNPQNPGTSPSNSVNGSLMLDGGQLNEWSAYSNGNIYIAWVGNWEGKSRRGETPITARE